MQYGSRGEAGAPDRMTGVRGHGWAAAGLVSDQSREEEELAALRSIRPSFTRRVIPGGKVRGESAVGRPPMKRSNRGRSSPTRITVQT